MQIDEELSKQLKAKELKSKQEVLRKRKSSEISTKERSAWQFRVSSPKRTIFFNPDRDSYQKFNLWLSAIYPAEVDLDIEELNKRFFLKKSIQVVPVWPNFKIASISKIDIQKFRKMPYAFFQGRRTKNSEFMFSEVDFPRINQADIISLIIWLKQRVSTDKAYADVLQRLRQYVLGMVIDFSVD
ncbi:unnamed protein product [Lactuca saligna]|uniref:Uncharacterized protein n=1 Tax=Lactuca saligna TaxID=75948 RepID=A0AA36ECZ7_LACSI|nr:unnamed protein product [Lactuca saligna]